MQFYLNGVKKSHIYPLYVKQQFFIQQKDSTIWNLWMLQLIKASLLFNEYISLCLLVYMDVPVTITTPPS